MPKITYAKWALVLVVISLTCLMGWLVAQPTARKQSAKTGPQPKLVFDRDSRDFGWIMVGEKVSHHYKIRNAGSAPLVIRKISTSCGCTVAKMDKTILQPGEKSIIDTELSVRRGNNSQRVYLHSNDPDHPRTTLKLLARGLDRVLLEPSGFDFTSLRLGVTQTNIVRLSAGDKMSFKITQAKLPEMDGLESTVKVLPVDATSDGKSTHWDIMLTATPRHYRWKDRDVLLKVVTDHPSFPEHSVNVFCSLRFPLQWAENTPHFLGVTQPGQSNKTELTIYSDDGVPFQILEARPLHDEAFQITSKALEGNTRHQLTLTADVPTDASEGFRSTRFLIRTDHPEAPELKPEPSFSIHVIDRQ